MKNVILFCEDKNKRAYQHYLSFTEINKFLRFNFRVVCKHEFWKESLAYDDFLKINSNDAKKSIVLITSWIGLKKDEFDKIRNKFAFIISDFQDCAEGLTYLPGGDINRSTQYYNMNNSDLIFLRDLRWSSFPTSRQICEKKETLLVYDFLLTKNINTPFKNKENNSFAFIGSYGVGENSDDLGYIKIFEKVLSQGSKVYFLPKKNHFNKHVDCEYSLLAKKFRKFIILNTVDSSEIFKKISFCEFGMNCIQSDVFKVANPRVNPTYLAGCSSSRICDYSESGLGVILTNSLKFMHANWNESGACYKLDSDNIDNIIEFQKHLKDRFILDKYIRWYNSKYYKNNLTMLVNSVFAKHFHKKTILGSFFMKKRFT